MAYCRNCRWTARSLARSLFPARQGVSYFALAQAALASSNKRFKALCQDFPRLCFFRFEWLVVGVELFAVADCFEVDCASVTFSPHIRHRVDCDRMSDLHAWQRTNVSSDASEADDSDAGGEAAFLKGVIACVLSCGSPDSVCVSGVPVAPDSLALRAASLFLFSSSFFSLL